MSVTLVQRKFDIRIDEKQRLNLLSALEHFYLTAKANGAPEADMEEINELHGMLNGEGGLEALVDPEAPYNSANPNTLNDFTA